MFLSYNLCLANVTGVTSRTGKLIYTTRDFNESGIGSLELKKFLILKEEKTMSIS